MSLLPQSPAAFAGRPLFEPISPLLARFDTPELPDLAALTRLIRTVAQAATSGGGKPIRFRRPTADDPAYEEGIFATGDVPTRPGDWHDFFNALAWCAWPKAKAACNALHVQAQRARRAAGLPGRGPLRDALTQFDECGVVVVSADPAIPALLAAHEWEEAFWHHRARLMASTRFLVCGHGTWDQMRRPFFGMCGKAVYRVVDPAWLALSPAVAHAETDAWLAAHLAKPEGFMLRKLAPLPLLGIPGVTPESESAAYYRDVRQFRPRRVGGWAQTDG